MLGFGDLLGALLGEEVTCGTTNAEHDGEELVVPGGRVDKRV